MGSEPGSPAGLPPAVLLMGPTAAGKTALAMTLYDQLPIRLISVDSAQVYRGLDIGSAKPDAPTLARYPHALINIREPEAVYSAADFVADAEVAMRAAAAEGRLPVLVGGTTLYFRALLYGLDALPAADAVVRERLAARARRLGWAGLHQELLARDPETARRIRPGDQQRIQRALEVLELTGRGLSAQHRQARLPRFESLRIVVALGSRQRLHERIAQRADAMLEAGLLEEVEALRQRPGLKASTSAMRSVGYRQAWASLETGAPGADLRLRIIAATRQLAKRQLTGFRKFARTLWYDPTQPGTSRMVVRQAADFAATRFACVRVESAGRAKSSKVPKTEK